MNEKARKKKGGWPGGDIVKRTHRGSGKKEAADGGEKWGAVGGTRGEGKGR